MGPSQDRHPNGKRWVPRVQPPLMVVLLPIVEVSSNPPLEKILPFYKQELDSIISQITISKDTYYFMGVTLNPYHEWHRDEPLSPHSLHQIKLLDPFHH